MAIIGVFDTNILFSATGWRGNPFRCVERARAGEIEVFTCPELLEELAEKLETRLHFSAEQVAQTLADHLSFLQIVDIPKILDAVPRDRKTTWCSNALWKPKHNTLSVATMIF